MFVSHAAFILIAAVLSAATGQVPAIVVDTDEDVQDAPDLSSAAALLQDPGPDGLISLREAILAANASPGEDTITFDSALTQPIFPQTGPVFTLEDSSGGTTIIGDGIVVNGAAYTGGVHGLLITSANNTVQGLTFINFNESGITIDGAGAAGNTIAGCRLGTTGTVAAGNGVAGIRVSNGAHDNVIGGVTAAERNIISGNDQVGVFIFGTGTTSNAVVGNYIGTNEAGAQAIPNLFNGITIGFGASGNLIGGVAAGAGNVISGNGRIGVLLTDAGETVSSQNTIAGNLVGLAANAVSPLGNGRWGIAIEDGPSQNFIGAAPGGPGANTIAFSGFDGIEIKGAASFSNRIGANSIFSNNEDAIDLINGGNADLQPPVINGINPVRGSCQTPSGQIDIYADLGSEAQTYLGSTTANDIGDFSTALDLSAAQDRNLTATVTDAFNNTSELSTPFAVSGGEGEGEGEGEPGANFGVELLVTEADNICQTYLNGDLILETQFGESPDGPIAGPGFSGPVDITDLMRPGKNIFRFLVQDTDCCNVSGFFELRVHTLRVFFDGIQSDTTQFGTIFSRTFALDWDPDKSDLLVEVLDAETSQPVPQAVVRVDPGGQTARVDENGKYRFLLDRPELYAATCSATGYQVAQSLSLLYRETTLTQSVTLFLTRSSGGSSDRDGDGLPDDAEIEIYGTNPNSADTDRDGMSDLFEVQYGLDNTRNDANEDADEDGFTNLREFFLRSDPRDPSSPRADFYVSTLGNDNNTGTKSSPWRTIAKAMATVPGLIGVGAPGEDAPVGLRAISDGTRAVVHLVAGVYQEDVFLQPEIRVQGAGLNQSIIRGRLFAARRSAVVDVKVEEPDSGFQTLVTVNTGPMLFERVTVQGRAGTVATGMLFSGTDPANVLVTDCVLARLATGIDVQGSLPLTRRTRFVDVSGDGFIIRAVDTKQNATGDNTLGQANRTGTGWNQFDTESIDGSAVVNERTETLFMENNDWNTDDANAIDAKISGPGDFIPFLAKGAGLLPASVVCTVWDGATNEPILDASVSIAPGGYEDLTENVDGIYTFAALPAGDYSVTVNAPGFDPLTQAASVSGGETGALVFAMGTQPVAPAGGCNCAKSSAAPPRPLHAYSGKFLVMAATLGVLLRVNRKRKQ